MRKLFLLVAAFLCLGFTFDGLDDGSGLPAERITVQSEGFDSNLSPLDDTVQKALETIDQLILGEDINWSEGTVLNMDGINWQQMDNDNVVIPAANWQDATNIPKTGINWDMTQNMVSKYDGAVLVDSAIYDDGSNITMSANGVSIDHVTAGSGGIDAYTTLMLHFNNNLTDSSSSPKSVSGASVTFNNSIYKFGSYSANFAGWYANVTPSGTALQMGTGDFTIDFWMYPTNVTAYRTAITSSTSGVSATSFLARVTDNSYFQVFVGDTAYTSSGTISTNQWYHVAVVRNSGAVNVYLNGVSVASGVGNTKNLTEEMRYIGGGLGYFAGQIDEVRFSKGIARWTAGFTPPTSEYTSGIYTPSLTLKGGGTQKAKLWIDGAATESFKIDVPSTTAVFIDNGQNVMIGDADPTARLQIKGAGTTSGTALLIEDSTGADKVTVLDSGTVKLNTLTTNGLLKVSGSDGTVGVDTSTYLTSVAFPDLTDYPADAAGVLTNDGSGNLSWGTGGGSQSPWTSDIETAGYVLLDNAGTPATSIDPSNRILYSGTSSFNAWATETDYWIGDKVIESATYYVCTAYHYSGTFATDLSDGLWVEVTPPLASVDYENRLLLDEMGNPVADWSASQAGRLSSYNGSYAFVNDFIGFLSGYLDYSIDGNQNLEFVYEGTYFNGAPAFFFDMGGSQYPDWYLWFNTDDYKWYITVDGDYGIIGDDYFVQSNANNCPLSGMTGYGNFAGNAIGTINDGLYFGKSRSVSYGQDYYALRINRIEAMYSGYSFDLQFGSIDSGGSKIVDIAQKTLNFNNGQATLDWGNKKFIGSWKFDDGDALLFGTGSDASIKYDGTDLVVNPKFVGSGGLSVLGNMNVSKAAPEMRLTDTGNGEYSRWTKSDTTNESKLLNRVTVLGADVDLIPTMTTNTAPSGTAFVSSSGDPTHLYYMFDKSNATSLWPFGAGGVKPHFYGYRFASATVVNRYTVLFSASWNTAWKFQGSNDGITYTDLDVVASPSVSANVKKTFDFTNTTPYSYYRIWSDVAAGPASVIEVEMKNNATSIQESVIFSSKDSSSPLEYGIQTYGDTAGRHVIEGITTRFNVAGVEKGQLGSTMAWTLPNTITGSRDAVQFKILGNSTQTSHLMDIFASDGVTARFHVDGTGSVGIGITNPYTKLHVHADGDYTIGTFSVYSNTAAHEPLFYLRRGRGTYASPTAVQGGDILGSVRFAGQYGSTAGQITTGAKIEAVVDSTWTAGADTPTYMGFYTTPDASGTPLERLRITSAGNVKIPADSKKLYFGSGDDAYLEFDSNSLNIVTNAVTSTDTLDITTHGVKLATPQTTTNGLTGTAVSSQPFQGTSYKKFIVYLSNFTSAGTVLTFPTAFIQTPYVYGDAAAIAVAVTTTTTCTLTSVGAVNGFIIIEGY